jgi:hypothetical protein
VEDYFTRLVQRVAPKSDAQARAEVVVTRRFLENFSGDQAGHPCRCACSACCALLPLLLLPAARACMHACKRRSCTLHCCGMAAGLPREVCMLRMQPKHAEKALARRSLIRLCMLACCAQVRFTARSFGVAGDHAGQMSTGMRWPFGPVALITPFNFPLEIPALQLLGAVFMGNKPLVHVDHRRALPHT